MQLFGSELSSTEFLENANPVTWKCRVGLSQGLRTDPSFLTLLRGDHWSRVPENVPEQPASREGARQAGLQGISG